MYFTNERKRTSEARRKHLSHLNSNSFVILSKGSYCEGNSFLVADELNFEFGNKTLIRTQIYDRSYFHFIKHTFGAFVVRTVPGLSSPGHICPKNTLLVDLHDLFLFCEQTAEQVVHEVHRYHSPRSKSLECVRKTSKCV